MWCVNRDSVTSPFPINVLLIYFSYIIALPCTFTMNLNSSGDRGHPSFVPNLSR